METKDEILDKHFDGFDGDEKLNFIQRELVKNAMEENTQEVVKNLHKPLVTGSLPFDFIKSYWSLSDDGIKQLEDTYTIWQKRQ